MASEITSTDNVFSVRLPMWHNLGTILEDYPTVSEAKAIAHPWEPVEEVLYRHVPSIDEAGNLSESFEKVEGFKGIARSDNGASLGVVTDTYEIVSNQEMYDILESLEKAARQDGDMPVKLETGGSLKGGRKVWLLARLEEPLKIKGDPKGDTVPYYTIQNSHDGSGAFRGQATMTRIVCDNTARASDLDARARGTEFVFRHTKNIKDRIEDARLALAGWRQGITFWSEMADHLTTVKVTPAERLQFIEAFVPLPTIDTTISDRVRNNVLSARDELRQIYASPTSDYTELTAWGMIQGAVEWSQHFRATKGRTDMDRMENRFARAYLSDSELTRKAVTLTKEIVSV